MLCLCYSKTLNAFWLVILIYLHLSFFLLNDLQYLFFSFAIPGESLQSVRVACRGAGGGCHGAGSHWPASQRVWHLQLPLVLAGSFHATGLRHLAPVREGNGACETNREHLWMRVSDRHRMKVFDSVRWDVFIRVCVWAGNSVCVCLTVCNVRVLYY